MPRFFDSLRGEMPLLAVDGLHVTFETPGSPPVYAVRGVSFALARNEVLGIVGESGSGKSAAMTAVAGLLPRNARVEGGINFRGQRVGVIFQEPGRAFDPLQRIGDAFFEAYRVYDKDKSRHWSDRNAARLLAETGIPDAAERLGGFPHQFSGGQLQRIGIALALAQDPDLLIADEPTTALDVAVQAQIIDLLKRIQQLRHLAIVFISHNIDAAAEICDRIMVLYGGKVMETGGVGDILEKPQHPYTRALLEAAPQFGMTYRDGPLAPIPGKVPDPRKPPPGCPFAPRCPYTTDACNKKGAGASCKAPTPLRRT